MRVVFMGTPKLSQGVLEILQAQENLDIVAVYTNKDSVSKRGKSLTPSPVKSFATSHNIEVQTPDTLKSEDVLSTLYAYKPDFICVAAYGKLLPKAVLECPKYECLNVHGSLLPKWRGAAPIERSILGGDTQTGVSIMRMEAGLDTGPYCIQKSFDIVDRDISYVQRKMIECGGYGLIEAMDLIANNKAKWNVQDESYVTYAEKLSKRELFLTYDMSYIEAYRCVLASSDAHKCKCIIADRGVNVLQACIVEQDFDYGVGDVIIENGHLYLCFKDGILQVLSLKPDGKGEMSAKSFVAGLSKNKSFTWQSF